MLSMLTLTDRDAYAHAYRVAALAVSVARTLGIPTRRLAALEHAGAAARPRQAGRAGSGPAQAGAADRGGADADPPASGDRRRAHRTRAVPEHAVADSSATRTSAWTAWAIRTGATPPRSSLGARIISVADAYDAMTRPRVFRDAIGPREALLELERCSRHRSSTRSSSSAFSRVWTRCKRRFVD